MFSEEELTCDGGRSGAQLRHWLHDMASELWAATGDQTLPPELSLDHVWITADGRAVLLDRPWPGVKTPATPIPVHDLDGQQRFLNAMATCVESTRLPLHARPVLRNLEMGKFEKLSFLTGTLRGLLDRPVEVTPKIRAGAIFMLPVYLWILVFVGYFRRGERPDVTLWDSAAWTALATALAILAVIAVVQLLELPFRSTASESIFRLAVVNARGERATVSNLFGRWAIVWLSLLVPTSLAVLMSPRAEGVAFVSALAWLLLWIGGAIYAVVHPYRALQDRLAGTWVVRR